MKRFTADDARNLGRANGKKVLLLGDVPDEVVKGEIFGVILKKIAGHENRAHFYIDPSDAPGSNIYFDPEDKLSLEQLSHLRGGRRWIIEAMLEAGYKAIVSKEIVCRNCTGLPSNPCDECSGKKPIGISFERQDRITHSYIEVRW